MCSRRSGRHPAGHRCAAFPPCPCRGREGTRDEQSAAVPAAEAPDIGDTPHAVIPAKAGIHGLLLFGFPLSSGEGRTDQPRAPHAGGARDRAETRPPFANRSLGERRGSEGAPFLWLLSFGQAKESNRRPWMVDEKHTDVSRLSREPQHAKPTRLPAPPEYLLPKVINKIRRHKLISRLDPRRNIRVVPHLIPNLER